MLVVIAFVFFAILALNLWTFLSFYADKQRAIAGERRIPESNLLGLALIGGSPAALLARQIFRHKTRKEPFSTYLWIIVALQIGSAIGLTIAFA